MSDHMKTITIAGIKLEVDERTARVVEQYRIGSRVKCLVKAGYGETYDIYPGVIVGFSPFAELPCIEVLYVKTGSFSADNDPFVIKTINEKTEGFEIAPLGDLEIMVDRDLIVGQFERAIAVAEVQLQEMRAKRAYFVEHFSVVFDLPVMDPDIAPAPVTGDEPFPEDDDD